MSDEDGIDVWEQEREEQSQCALEGRAWWPEIATPAAAPLEDEESIRGKCPNCGAPVRSQLVFVGGRGSFLLWRCDNNSPVLSGDPVCDFMELL